MEKMGKLQRSKMNRVQVSNFYKTFLLPLFLFAPCNSRSHSCRSAPLLSSLRVTP
jgi:hypothetical protein